MIDKFLENFLQITLRMRLLSGSDTRNALCISGRRNSIDATIKKENKPQYTMPYDMFGSKAKTFGLAKTSYLLKLIRSNKCYKFNIERRN